MRYQLTNHMRSSHGSEMRFECCYCMKKFKKQFVLKLHAKREHGTENIYACPDGECSEAFPVLKKLKIHRLEVHKEEMNILTYLERK